MNTNPIQIPADQKLQVTLEAQQWGIVIAGLGELPQKVSGVVANQLMEQLQFAAGGQMVPAGAPSNGTGVVHAPAIEELQ